MRAEQWQRRASVHEAECGSQAWWEQIRKEADSRVKGRARKLGWRVKSIQKSPPLIRLIVPLPLSQGQPLVK